MRREFNNRVTWDIGGGPRGPRVKGGDPGRGIALAPFLPAPGLPGRQYAFITPRQG